MLLRKGYWQKTYWQSGYWAQDFWLEGQVPELAELKPRASLKSPSVSTYTAHKPGYWQGKYWSYNYFNENFWQDVTVAADASTTLAVLHPVGILKSPTITATVFETLTAGYWDRYFWPPSFWEDNVWPEFGSNVVVVEDVPELHLVAVLQAPVIKGGASKTVAELHFRAKLPTPEVRTWVEVTPAEARARALLKTPSLITEALVSVSERHLIARLPLITVTTVERNAIINQARLRVELTLLDPNVVILTSTGRRRRMLRLRAGVR